MNTELKRAAAERAASLVTDGMRLGLGTGSTAVPFVAAVGRLVREGMRLVGVPTSEATRLQAEREGIPLVTLDDISELDLTVDGADEIDGELRLIKGAGGAHLREKIVAAASRRMVIVADGSKRVERLGGGRYPVPIEVVPFGLAATRRLIGRVLGDLGLPEDLRLRMSRPGEPFVTDGGHLILDAHLGSIPDPDGLAVRLDGVPGLMEHGLFIGFATGAVIATEGGLVELGQV